MGGRKEIPSWVALVIKWVLGCGEGSGILFAWGLDFRGGALLRGCAGTCYFLGETAMYNLRDQWLLNDLFSEGWNGARFGKEITMVLLIFGRSFSSVLGRIVGLARGMVL